MIDTTSRGLSPSATNPSPTCRAWSPYSLQVIDRQIPRSFSRIATLSPHSRTTCQNNFGNVSCPNTVEPYLSAAPRVRLSLWIIVPIVSILSPRRSSLAPERGEGRGEGEVLTLSLPPHPHPTLSLSEGEGPIPTLPAPPAPPSEPIARSSSASTSGSHGRRAP